MALFGLLVFALLLPNQANQIAQQVLGSDISLPVISNAAAPVTNSVSALISSLSNKAGQSSATTSSTDDSAVISGDSTGPLSVEDIIDATNEERIKNGLPPLKTNIMLEESAKIKTQDMVANDYFAHTSPSGKTVAGLGHEVGYDYVVMGENLAVGDFTSSQDLLTAWMNSPEHRANILNPSYQDIGVYAEEGTYQGQLVWFAVQHFGTERGVCPSLNTTLKTQIDALNTSITNQEAAITALRLQIEDPNHVQGQAYDDMITSFNTMVARYNSDLTISQNEISVYNKQVVAFNNCLAQYQTPTATPTTPSGE